MSFKPTPPFGMPSAMGEIMATLLLIVDAWYELARETMPHRVQPSDRVDVLGLLVRLVAHHSRGFRHEPNPDDVRPLLTSDSVGLAIRSRRRSSEGLGQIEPALARYGFRIRASANVESREVVVCCRNLAGAQVIAFPGPAARICAPKKRGL